MRTSSTRTRTTQLTATEGAVLALLEIEGERSGYDLLKHVSSGLRFKQMIFAFGNALRISGA